MASPVFVGGRYRFCDNVDDPAAITHPMIYTVTNINTDGSVDISWNNGENGFRRYIHMAKHMVLIDGQMENV